jgi:hypothetical protein
MPTKKMSLEEDVLTSLFLEKFSEVQLRDAVGCSIHIPKQYFYLGKVIQL